MKPLPLLILAALASLAAPGLGQTGGDGGTGHEKFDPTKAKRIVYEKRSTGMAEITYHIDGRIDERILGEAEVVRLRKLGTIGTSRTDDLRATAHARPARLAPGQSGELLVVVILGGKAVALPGSQADLKLDAAGSPLRFGAPKLDPAKPGRMEGKYKGKPVYDDMMIFRVPLRIVAGAAFPQDARVRGTLEAALYDSETGHVLGTFVSHVDGVVKIVRATATSPTNPKGAGGDAVKDGSTGNPDTRASETRTPANGGAGQTGGTESGVVRPPGGAADRVGDPGVAGDPGSVPPTPFRVSWVLGVVVLLGLVVLVLLLARGR
jgi:hypothetical protein